MYTNQPLWPRRHIIHCLSSSECVQKREKNWNGAATTAKMSNGKCLPAKIHKCIKIYRKYAVQLLLIVMMLWLHRAASIDAHRTRHVASSWINTEYTSRQAPTYLACWHFLFSPASRLTWSSINSSPSSTFRFVSSYFALYLFRFEHIFRTKQWHVISSLILSRSPLSFTSIGCSLFDWLANMYIRISHSPHTRRRYISIAEVPQSAVS